MEGIPFLNQDITKTNTRPHHKGSRSPTVAENKTKHKRTADHEYILIQHYEKCGTSVS